MHLRFVLWSGLCLSGIFWLFVSRRAKKELSSFVCSWLFGIGAGGCLTAWISLSGAENLGEGLFTCLHICLAGVSLILSMALFSEYPKSPPVICRWATAGAVLLVVFGLWGAYWQDGRELSPFFFRGIMINKNLYAASLFLFTPFVIYTLASSRKIWFWTAALVLPVLWGLIFMSGARSVFAAMTLGLVPVFLLIFRYCFNPGFRTRIIACLVCFLLALIFLFMAGAGFHSPEKKASVRLRLALWHHTLHMIEGDPVLGVGPGHWRLALHQYADPQRVETHSGDIIEVHAQRPHNMFLGAAAEIGVTGGMLFFAFFACIYGYAGKILKKSKNRAETNLVLAMTYGVSGFLIFGMFSYPSERPLHTFLFMITTGIIASVYRRHYPSCVRPVHSGVLISVFMVFIFFCTMVSGLRLYSEIHLKAALSAKDQNAWHRVVARIDRVIFPLYSIDPFGVPLSWYRGVAYFHLDNLPKAKENFSQAIEYQPFHRHSINALSFLEKNKIKK